jgi:hypothetical protein
MLPVSLDTIVLYGEIISTSSSFLFWWSSMLRIGYITIWKHVTSQKKCYNWSICHRAGSRGRRGWWTGRERRRPLDCRWRGRGCSSKDIERVDRAWISNAWTERIRFGSVSWAAPRRAGSFASRSLVKKLDPGVEICPKCYRLGSIFKVHITHWWLRSHIINRFWSRKHLNPDLSSLTEAGYYCLLCNSQSQRVTHTR